MGFPVRVIEDSGSQHMYQNTTAFRGDNDEL